MRRQPTAGLVVLGLAALTACSTPDAPPTESPDPQPSASEAAGGDGATVVSLPFEGGYDWRIAVAPDGATALVAWSEGFFPRTRQSTIFEVTLDDDGSWGNPVEVPFVSEESQDIDPAYSPDGTRVWFSSIRAVDGAPRGDVEVWSVERRPDGGWGDPVHEAHLSSPGDDLYPSVGPDGALYVGSDREDDDFDLWRSAATDGGGWEAPARLPAPVTQDGSAWEFNPVVAPDGSALVFTALNRGGGPGLGDLYVAQLGADGSWAEPELLASVSTAADEYHPSFSPDGQTLYFVRSGNLLQIPVASTELSG